MELIPEGDGKFRRGVRSVSDGVRLPCLCGVGGGAIHPSLTWHELKKGELPTWKPTGLLSKTNFWPASTFHGGTKACESSPFGAILHPNETAQIQRSMRFETRYCSCVPNGFIDTDSGVWEPTSATPLGLPNRVLHLGRCTTEAAPRSSRFESLD